MTMKIKKSKLDKLYKSVTETDEHNQSKSQ